MTQNNFPHLGFGLGLRTKHYPYIFENKPPVDWFEIISENFMDTDGKPKRNLARIKEHYPIVMHGVAMSIGTADPLNSEYLQKLKALIKWAQPAWISDHLCWTGVAHKNSHDLLPVPYTEEALKHIIGRIKEVQDYLECPLTLENPSTYLEFKSSTMPEAEFIARMAKESGCNLLLDVNNVYVTCYNHRLDPKAYIDALPLDRVAQIHLSGHSNKGTHIIDTHDNYVVDEVWNIYKYVVSKAGRTPNTMVEWDDSIPEFPVLFAELEKARVAAKDPSGYKLPDLARDQVAQRLNYAPPLPEAQALMQDSIMLGEKFDGKPNEWIRAKEQFAPQDQLNVYINSYRYRLNDVTAEDYPVLNHYLGEKAFNALTWDFVNSEQPDNFNIARYALKFPTFVKRKHPEDVLAQELCTMETAVAQLVDAPETEALDQKHLAGMTPEILMESKLYPRKALQLFAFTYPVNEYYRQVMEEENPTPPAPAANHVVVYRHEDVVWRMDLEENEYHLLQMLFSGVTVGQALATLPAKLSLTEDELSAHLSSWFSRWIRNGLLRVNDQNESAKRNAA